jgi:hypothetical protein
MNLELTRDEARLLVSVLGDRQATLLYNDLNAKGTPSYDAAETLSNRITDLYIQDLTDNGIMT